MALAGGSADKSGNSYEGRWTVLHLLRVLRGDALSIRLEPPGPEGEGVEFWLQTAEGREYHQVKRQQTGKGHWTTATLVANGVLTAFGRKLDRPDAQCLFVSTEKASELDDLSDLARGASSFAEYQEHFLQRSMDRRDAWGRLVSVWADLSEQEVWERLQRVRIETISERLLSEQIKPRAEFLLDGNPSSVEALLAQLALDSVHRELRAYDIARHLADNGHALRRWADNPHVLAAVDAANERYLVPLRAEAISGELFSREEARQALDLLSSDAGKRLVLLSGGAGSGKSSLLPQLIDAARAWGWPTLAFRVDRLLPITSIEELGRKLGLSASPVATLAGVADGSPCLLVIDQLDAVSQASGRHSECYELIDLLIRHAALHPNMRVLVACREFDLQHDNRFRRLLEDESRAAKVHVALLSAQQVQAVVAALGLAVDELTAHQLELLRLPLHLKLLAEAALLDRTATLRFDAAHELFEQFWDAKRRATDGRLGRPAAWTQVCDRLCEFMSSNEQLTAPRTIVEEHEADARAMVSEHVLTAEGVHYAFFHEAFFDYVFARRFAAKGESLLCLLRQGEQGLFRRAQVRQILHHQRATDRRTYLNALQTLLLASDVRFHLKALALAVVGQVPDPTEDEWLVLQPFLEGSAAALADHTRGALHGSVPWMGCSSQKGHL